MTSAQLAPAIILPLVAWRVYSRVRRNIGRQRFAAKRLQTRVWVFSGLTVVIALGAAFHLAALLALAGGIAVSVVLAWFGVRLTRFERSADGVFYTPNTAIGVGVSLLLVGRLVYRFVTLYPAISSGEMTRQPADFQSPLTFAIFGLTIGYYVAYYLGILIRATPLATENRKP